MTKVRRRRLRNVALARWPLVLSFFVLAGAVTAISAWSRGPQLVAPGPLVAARFPDLPSISTEELAGIMDSGEERILLLDSRTQQEYQVSHLDRALRIDPDTPEFGRGVLESNAVIVVYCSVGYRSASVVEALLKAGHKEVFNLEGGLFQWANEDRPLFSNRERATTVHPYDRRWGGLLRSDLRAPLP